MLKWFHFGTIVVTMRLGLFLLFSMVAFAWEDHFLVTLAALQRMEALTKSVPFEPFEYALGKSKPKFCEQVKIKKQWTFPHRLSEKPGTKHSLLSILSTYSDEPDWGLDQNLFATDQYPELWDADKKYVALKTGLKSQAFRHLYLPGKFLWKDPFASLQIPMRPLGEAPERAELYFNIALDLFKKNHPYWGARFLGWSLHYLEDLFNPFHTCQTPSKMMIRLAWNKFIPTIDFEGTAEQLGYYHYSFETSIRREMNASQSRHLRTVSGEDFDRVTLPLSDWVKTNVIPTSSSQADYLGARVRRVYAPWEPTESEKAEDAVGTKKWEMGINQDRVEPLYELSLRLFSKMGAAVRGTVHAALSQ